MISRSALPFFIAGLLFLGCGHSAAGDTNMKTAASFVRTVQEVAISSGIPVATADISIDGMSCEMMCGGSIKKALAKLPGVASTEIEFIEGDERDHAIVSYDDTKVTDAEMIDAIQTLHDGQYKVMEVKVIKEVISATSSNKEAAKPKESGAVAAASCAPTSSVIIPSLFAILSRILIR